MQLNEEYLWKTARIWKGSIETTIERMEASIDFRVDAVLPAGGVGERMGEKMPKQVRCVHAFKMQGFDWINFNQKV